jgi:hypothetical protein
MFVLPIPLATFLAAAGVAFLSIFAQFTSFRRGYGHEHYHYVWAFASLIVAIGVLIGTLSVIRQDFMDKLAEMEQSGRPEDIATVMDVNNSCDGSYVNCRGEIGTFDFLRILVLGFVIAFQVFWEFVILIYDWCPCIYK